MRNARGNFNLPLSPSKKCKSVVSFEKNSETQIKNAFLKSEPSTQERTSSQLVPEPESEPRKSIPIVQPVPVEKGIVIKRVQVPHYEPVQPQQKREGVIAESMFKEILSGEDIKTRRYSKDAGSEKLIKDAIMGNEFLNNLDPVQIDAIVEAMYLKDLDDNSFVITEGEPGSHLYVSAEGMFEVQKERKRLRSGVRWFFGRWVCNAYLAYPECTPLRLCEFGPGTAFGELAILYNSKRMASIKVLKAAKVWVLERREFQRIMMRTGIEQTREKVKFLRSVPLLYKLSNEVLTKMSDLLQVEFYTAGTKIVTQGDRRDAFYIISGGTVLITKQSQGETKEKEVGKLGRGDFFGEFALINEDRRQATVKALAPGVECLILERESFVNYLGHLSELEQSDYGSAPKPSVPAPVKQKSEYSHIELKDLTVIGTLGVGGFGRVELVQYSKDKRQTFALKRLKKVHVVEQQQEEHAYNEKAVMLQCTDCTFISRLYRTYRDTRYIYFLMEPCLGGDVFTLLQKNRFFDDRTGRFMTACVIEALEFLHGKGFIFRDLKPENLLLDTQGYIKMIDFGFAKGLGSSGKTWTFAGTPEYVAPEIILNKGHDRAVDYWALGVLMHEFLTGRPPFRGSDHMKTYNLILKGIEAVQFPKYVQEPASHLIRRLCRAVPTERMGYQKAGVKDIKNHKWFQGFDWLALRTRTMRAPIVQPISGPTDLSHFDKYKKNTKVPPQENSGWDKDF